MRFEVPRRRCQMCKGTGETAERGPEVSSKVRLFALRPPRNGWAWYQCVICYGVGTVPDVTHHIFEFTFKGVVRDCWNDREEPPCPSCDTSFNENYPAAVRACDRCGKLGCSECFYACPKSKLGFCPKCEDRFKRGLR